MGGPLGFVFRCFGFLRVFRLWVRNFGIVGSGMFSWGEEGVLGGFLGVGFFICASERMCWLFRHTDFRNPGVSERVS